MKRRGGDFISSSDRAVRATRTFAGVTSLLYIEMIRVLVQGL